MVGDEDARSYQRTQTIAIGLGERQRVQQRVGDRAVRSALAGDFTEVAQQVAVTLADRPPLREQEAAGMADRVVVPHRLLIWRRRQEQQLVPLADNGRRRMTATRTLLEDDPVAPLRVR